MMLTNWSVSSKAAPAEQILANSELIHRYRSYPVGLRDPSAIFRLIKELRAREWPLCGNRGPLPPGIASREAFRVVSSPSYDA